MALGAQQWLNMVSESSYGVTQTTSPTTDWIRLDRGNSFTMVPKRNRHTIRSADSFNRKAINIAGRFPITGRLELYLYSDSGAGALPVCDRMLGWATTLTSNDLPSFTLRHWDGVRAREYLGCKCASCHVFAASETEEGCFRMELDLVAQKFNATDPSPFAQPAITVYPKSPYVFPESKGGLIAATSGSTPRTIYKNFDLMIRNTLVPSWDEDIYITDATWNGREINWSFQTRFRSKADRDAFEAQTSYTGSIVLTKVTPAHTLTLSLQAANYVPDIGRTFDLGNPTYETINFETFLDTVSGTDFGYVAT